MKIVRNFDNFLNSYLFSNGIKKIIKTNIAILGILFLTTLCTFYHSTFIFWIFFGCILTFWNFFLLAIFIQKLFNSNKLNKNFTTKFIVRQILISNLRLFITGILMYSSLIYWNANPFALVVGLSIPIITIPLLLLFKNS